jgi:hypothetical protein
VNPVLAFVEAPEDDRGKGNGPDAIVDFFKGDRFVGERDRNKQRPAPRDVAILIDAADLGDELESGIAIAGRSARVTGRAENWSPVNRPPDMALFLLASAA